MGRKGNKLSRRDDGFGLGWVVDRRPQGSWHRRHRRCPVHSCSEHPQPFCSRTPCTMIRGRLSCIARRSIHENILGCRPKSRGISASSSSWAKKMPDRPQPLDESEFTEAFLKGSGPGGQKIVSIFLHLSPYNYLPFFPPLPLL